MAKMLHQKEFITRKYPFWKGRFLPNLAFFFFGIPKNSFGSVDVTNRCNLRCKHCYFFTEPPGHELEPNELVEKVRALHKNKGRVWSCTWVGGEPLLRPEIIEQLIPNFRHNTVVTNGTIPLPDWNASFYVSLDGTKDVHDHIRGKGSYEKLKKNVTGPENYGKAIRLACCLNKINRDSIEPLLEEWHPCQNVKEMIFDFMTPITGFDDSLWIPFEERDMIIDKIIDLKRKKYGRFISAPETAYLLMKKANRHKVVGKNCSFLQKGFAVNACGELKQKCMLGPKADCDRCGCIVPFYLKSRERKYILRSILRCPGLRVIYP